MKAILVITTDFFKFEYYGPLIINDIEAYPNFTEEEVDSLFTNQDIWSAFGNVFKKKLTNEAFFYTESNIDDKSKLLKYVYYNEGVVSQLFDYLWFAKDCCCSIDAGYLFVNKETANIIRKSSLKSKADGTYSHTEFSLIDVHLALKLHKIYREHSPHFKSPDDLVDEDLVYHKPTNGVKVMGHSRQYQQANRIERAMGFLALARRTSMLAQKITFHIHILEALFSGNIKVDIQYRLCYRIAFYIGEHLQDRERIYKLIKDCYSIRSGFVHGQTIESKYTKENKLKEYAIDIDNLLRKIMLKVFTQDLDKFTLKDDALEKWLTDLILTR